MPAVSRQIAAARMIDSLAQQKAEAVLRMHARGLPTLQISSEIGLPYWTCRAIIEAPQWPKLVTRIHEDGTATLVRCA